jgi:hypothetical protein
MTGTAAETTCIMLPLKELRLNGGTQMRAELDLGTIQEYAEIFDELPPVVVFEDDRQHYWLADGFYRAKAAIFAGRDAINCEVRQGTRREAVLFAVGSNANHGVRRTNADKRKCVLALLSDREWAKWSSHEIARQCGVAFSFVHTLRKLAEGPSPNPNRQRLAAQGGRIIETPAEHRKGPVSSNSSNGNGKHGRGKTVRTIRCPYCRKRFPIP